jgi:tetratricopeptide (TPR) repeat protein
MTPSPDLHQLIRSLNKKEKAWFKHWCGRDAKATIYMQVFDAIAKQTVYDEALLKARFKGASFLSRLPAVKNYLFTQITEALFELHTSETPYAASSRELVIANLLIRKGMFHTVRKKLVHLYQKLIEQEMFLLAIETLVLQKHLLRLVNPPEIADEIEALVSKEKKLLEQYSNLSAYQYLSDLYDMKRRRILHSRTIKEELFFKKLLAQPLLTNEKNARSFEALFLFHRINSNCNHVIGNIQKTMHHRRKLVQLFESLPKLTPIQLSKYSGVLFDLAIAHRSLGNSDEALKINTRLKSLNTLYPQFRTENNKAVVFKRSAVVESDVLQFAGRFAEGVQSIPYWEKNLIRYKAFIEKDIELIIRYNIALLYYGDGKLRKALQWLNSIINENEHDYVQDVLCFARIFRMFIHIDIGNDELIDSIVRSTSNYLNKRKRLYTTENLLLKFAMRLTKPLTREKQHSVYRDLLLQLEKLKKNRFEQSALEYFDCVTWLKAQLTGRSFADVYKERKMVS